jgi:Spirocyclase AveC-like
MSRQQAGMIQTADYGRRIVTGNRYNVPVVFWAVAGTVILATEAWTLLAWIASADFRSAAPGDSPVTAGFLYFVRAVEWSVFALGLFLLWRVLVKPVVQTGSVSWDGMFLLAVLLLWWQDPMLNYVNFGFTYNAYLLNMGSWADKIPGISYVNVGRRPEPLLLMGGFYAAFYFCITAMGCATLRMVKRRHPDLGTAGMLVVLLLFMILVDAAIEVPFMLSGICAYPGVVHSLAFFAGKPWQWPVYEGVLIGAQFAAYTCLRFYRDDKGRSWVERGLDAISLPAAGKKVLSFLAICGFVQVYMIVCYQLPFNMITMQADTAPALPTYLNNGICGQGTGYACPSKQYVPLPFKGGVNQVGPEDPRLPAAIRERNKPGQSYGWFNE